MVLETDLILKISGLNTVLWAQSSRRSGLTNGDFQKKYKGDNFYKYLKINFQLPITPHLILDFLVKYT